MRKLFLLLAAFSFVIACQAPKRRPIIAPNKSVSAEPASVGTLHYEGGQGATCNDAVVIVGAQGESDGVRAEYRWIAERFPGYGMKSQALTGRAGKSFDVITFTTADGETKTACFDITGFFGKW